MWIGNFFYRATSSFWNKMTKKKRLKNKNKYFETFFIAPSSFLFIFHIFDSWLIVFWKQSIKPANCTSHVNLLSVLLHVFSVKYFSFFMRRKFHACYKCQKKKIFQRVFEGNPLLELVWLQKNTHMGLVSWLPGSKNTHLAVSYIIFVYFCFTYLFVYMERGWEYVNTESL